jgi:hypothetical protein
VGATRVRAKMAAAVELAGLVGRGEVDAALGTPAAAGRRGRVQASAAHGRAADR